MTLFLKLSLTLFCTMLIGTQAVSVCPTSMAYDKLLNPTFYGCVLKLPNAGSNDYSTTGNGGTLRRAVSDWIAAEGASSSTVVATYGPIEDWDVSEVTNMKYVFYGGGASASTFGSFNADLSKWNTGAVTTMQGSKCTLSSSLCDNSSFIGTQNSHTFFYKCIVFCLWKRGTCTFLLFVVGWSFLFFVAPSLLQCFVKQLRSILTYPTGIRGR